MSKSIENSDNKHLVNLKQIERIENLITNFLVSKGYSQGFEFTFEPRTTRKMVFVVKNIRLLKVQDLAESFEFALKREHFLVGHLRQIDTLAGRVLISIP